jgi:uncharacterized protein (DUF2062 family)
MGIFPIWGAQLLTAITLAFLLRLNKTLVIIAANISIPPMIPFILYLSHLTGKVWMGEKAQSISFDNELTLQFFLDNGMQYFLGAITLATVAAILFGVITYGFLKLSRRK